MNRHHLNGILRLKLFCHPRKNSIYYSRTLIYRKTNHQSGHSSFSSLIGSSPFPGTPNSTFTSRLGFVDSNDLIPIYRIIDDDGSLIDKNEDPNIPQDQLLEMYRKLVFLRSMDDILYEAQRQGRISFYMTCRGEEAIGIGTGAAFHLVDMIFGQYREAGVLLWRGFTVEQFINQCLGNQYDFGKSKQIPLHYGSKELNFQTVSSPVATQLLHAVGAAYVLKRSEENRCTVCYFGEGAASEGDSHAALNFAATLECPVVFICRNNGFAISTRTHEQYRGDGIAGRGVALGISSTRVDGNDLLAVYKATLAARRIALVQRKPVLLETMTYRVGNHSTSDDSSTYRSSEELKYWKDINDPIRRMRCYLEKKFWWNEEKDRELLFNNKKFITNTLQEAEKARKPSIDHLFTDVYDKPPLNLREQQKALRQHLDKYPDHYDLDQYIKS